MITINDDSNKTCQDTGPAGGEFRSILLSSFSARPLWNTSVLGPLFLVSGLSTGAATIIWVSKNHVERKLFSKIVLSLILVELFLITHMIMSLFRIRPNRRDETSSTAEFDLFAVRTGAAIHFGSGVTAAAGSKSDQSRKK